MCAINFFLSPIKNFRFKIIKSNKKISVVERDNKLKKANYRKYHKDSFF